MLKAAQVARIAFGFEAVAGYEHKAPETFEEVTATEEAPVVKEDEPVVRTDGKIPPKPADDLSDILKQFAEE